LVMPQVVQVNPTLQEVPAPQINPMVQRQQYYLPQMVHPTPIYNRVPVAAMQAPISQDPFMKGPEQTRVSVFHVKKKRMVLICVFLFDSGANHTYSD
jgi:hypothetical protein